MSKIITIKDTEWVKEQISNGDVAKLGGKSLNDILSNVNIGYSIAKSKVETSGDDFVDVDESELTLQAKEGDNIVVICQGTYRCEDEDDSHHPSFRILHNGDIIDEGNNNNDWGQIISMAGNHSWWNDFTVLEVVSAVNGDNTFKLQFRSYDDKTISIGDSEHQYSNVRMVAFKIGGN